MNVNKINSETILDTNLPPRKNTLISVIMGIYNCETTLPDALDCLLKQTYPNLEIILCDDGSKDNTYGVAFEYAQNYKNIILLKNDKNRGLNYTLNRCLKEAKGDFIARMDGDDVCALNRIEKEMLIFEQHPELAIVSTGMYFFDEHGIWGKCSVKQSPDVIDVVRHTPHCHAPCLVRKRAYDAVGGYTDDKKYLRVEDYDLWIKMYAKGFIGENINEPLYMMRDDRNATNRRKFKYRINEARVKIKAVNLLHLKKIYYLYAIRPIIVGLLPRFIYEYLHKTSFSLQQGS